MMSENVHQMENCFYNKIKIYYKTMDQKLLRNLQIKNNVIENTWKKAVEAPTRQW